MQEVNQVKKTSINDDELEKGLHSHDAANILERKNETQTSFEYLKNNTDESFSGYSGIFWFKFEGIFSLYCVWRKKEY